MNPFMTLMWLEFRKYSAWLIGFAVTLVSSVWLFNQMTGAGGDEGRVGAFAIGLSAMIGLIMIFIFFYGAEAGRDYRSGRWSLLLGSPLPGWMQMGSRVLFAFLAITLFSALMLGLMHIMLIKPMGIVIPLGFYLSLWLYGLGGLPLILFGLFGTLFTTAYLPRKTQNIAGFVAVLGSGSLLALLSQLLSKIMFSLPPWIIPMPTVDGVPIDFKDSDVQFGNHLPTEGFVALLLISALLFYATSRMWTEVEA